ncbi:MAG: type I DNA topoisomerase [Ruminococcus sp.]|nr:type I DNA topoisomerase [Ruminococcus sp.]MCM1391588.1 type I DNA topoisomerase [Ruminococcus sp.]
MPDLIIVESPSKAKTLKNYLGKGYTVVASKGHVRDLPPSRLSVDVKHDFAAKYTIVKGKENLVKELKAAVADSDKVFLATDPDREGEAISWHLAELLGLNLEESNRVTFNEITKTGVKNGMAAPRKVDMDLVNAQQARRILDRLVGYKLSPFVSQKIRRGLSAGRVQSVAVRMIVDREEEIRAFVPEEYWTIDGKFTAPNKRVINAAFYGDETGKLKLENEQQADEILARLENAVYTISVLKKGTRKKNPAPPFITSTLQQEAARKLGFRAERTMKIAQELYEGIEIKGQGSVGLITYMRTDSLRISEEARAAADSFVRRTYGDKYMPEKPRYFKSRSNAQDGHEAIRPSSVELIPEIVKPSLTAEQYKLYSLIWRRFLASLMAQCIQNTAKLEIKGVGENEKEGRYCLFTASGYSVKFDGFTVLYDLGDEEKSKQLPEGLAVDDNLKRKDLVKDQHFTQPPARYSEETLIKTLEENGVGRPSTYATIISTIVKREYVTRKAKQLSPTELGETITNLLKEKFPKIVNTKFTAQMEDDLDRVGGGEEDYIKILHEFYGDFEKTLEKAKTDMQGVKIQLKEDQTDIPCEKCGRMMVVKVGRFGKFLACPGYPECKTTKPYVVETGATCPKCGGKVISKKSKRGYVFFGCDHWPDCDFMTWDKPTEEKCPNCGKSLFKARGGVTHCLDEKCGFKKSGKKNKEADG